MEGKKTGWMEVIRMGMGGKDGWEGQVGVSVAVGVVKVTFAPPPYLSSTLTPDNASPVFV